MNLDYRGYKFSVIRELGQCSAHILRVYCVLCQVADMPLPLNRSLALRKSAGDRNPCKGSSVWRQSFKVCATTPAIVSFNDPCTP